MKSEKTVITGLWHNPLDNVMEKYDGMSILATDIMFEKGIDGDPVLAEQYLANWMKRHSSNYFFVGDRIKIQVTRKDEGHYNRAIHEKNNKKWKVMK
jgi:hypothetical protein